MSEYVVRFGRLAANDLQSSYDCCVENWGRERADDWVRRLEKLIVKRLALLPLACPLAPETREYEFDLRHLVVHRYRVLFTVADNEVYVMRFRGPFSGHTFALE